MPNRFSGERAVVIGAGMGGLPAAQALADYFREVVVLERDALPSDSTPRPGVPQGKHPHGLLAGGFKALCDLFPGFSSTLVQAGAHSVDSGLEVYLEYPGQDPFPARSLGVATFTMTRPLLELAVRRRVHERPNVVFRDGCRVVAIGATPDGNSVASVSYKTRGGKLEILPADLVVDASGRGKPTLDLLEATGRPMPEETVIGVDFGYSTAVYTIAPDVTPDMKVMYTMPKAPEESRMGIVLLREDGKWFAALGGRGTDTPPADGDAFADYAASLPTATVYHAIKNATLHGHIEQFAFPESRRRHFDSSNDFPRGLIPIADSVCRFNPVYGQGMSAAAQEAVVLRNLLAAHAGDADPLATLSSEFLLAIESIVENPWTLAALPDLAYPDARGKRPADLEKSIEHHIAVTQAAHQDPDIHKLLIEVLNLLKPVSALKAPEVMRKVTSEEVKACVGPHGARRSEPSASGANPGYADAS
ncbi:FAD-dependent oxidoreductase [Paraburkholderia sp. 35.1]|uniref:FAD-dependent oxidoreductase n=1 Tax=Paraburkholderia sp. 35.1 TaxID=2991058 RepID=UPI003D24C99D